MKYSADLYIVAAGKGSRMGGNVPKALIPITDEPNLTTTLKQIGHKFENVFIVTNIDIQDQWAEFFSDIDPALLANVTNLPIHSGLGDGHAIMQAFDSQALDKIGQNQDIVICWGDVFFQHGEIIDEMMIRQMGHGGIVPAVKENDPYVTLLTDEYMNIMSADFSKYGEHHPTGFHDQSVFRFHLRTLQKSLRALHNAFFKNGRYITQAGELSMLYAFHHLYNTAYPVVVYETDYPTLSFNTKEEVASIQLEINTKWKNTQSSSR